MLEYMVISDEFENNESLTNLLNIYSRDGWRVVCRSYKGLILEREKRPLVEESENEMRLTYTWEHD